MNLTQRRSFLGISLILILLHFRSWSQTQPSFLTFTNRQGTVYENVRVVKVNKDGLTFSYSDGIGGGHLKLSDLPDNVLIKLGFNPAQALNEDKEKARQEANRRLDVAISSGMFREVSGIVYDLRKPQSGWVIFQNVKLLQRLENGSALVDAKPLDPNNYDVLHVKHLPPYSDSDFFSFRAKPTGVYSYTSKADTERSVRSYDVGRICARNEIPEELLRGEVAFARISESRKSISEILPSSDADSLTATGTGFFITEDGFLVTNNHVVSGAKKVRIRAGSKTLDAKVVKTSRAFDLAILKVEGVFKCLPLDFDRQMDMGDSVFTIGFPNVDVQGAAPKYTDGKISSLSGIEDDPSQFQVTVPIQPGNSGGPLIAENGGVVGIVRAKLNDITALENSGSVPQNVNYAVKSKYLKDLLETIPGATNKIKFPTSKSKADGAVKATEEAAVIVLVY